MNPLRRRWLMMQRDESGVALLMVIGTMMVLTLIVFAATASSLINQKQARADTDRDAAFAAAQAGLDSYVSQLNRDPNYWKYGDPANSYGAGGSYSLPTGASADPALTTWREVDGSFSRAWYRYEVNNAQFMSSGLILLRVTGKVGQKSRTLEATIKRRDFSDYMYFTDLETQTPADYSTANGDTLSATQAQNQCLQYGYNGRIDNLDGSTTGCTVFGFRSNDVMNGPVHSNDILNVCGSPTFNGRVSTGWPGKGFPPVRWRGLNYSGCSNIPTFSVAGDPERVGTLPLPGDVFSVRPPYSGSAAVDGCLYTGPTRITFAADGTMTVESPWSTNGGALWCGLGSGIAIPSSGRIYVQAVADNSDAYTVNPSQSNGLGKSLGYPINEDITNYDSRGADAFVSGTLRGRLTITTEHDIVLIGDTTYARGTTSTDLLGLVAENNVLLYHPVTHQYDLQPWINPVIQAAILAVTGSFRDQNDTQGAAMGTLRVMGSVAGKFHGPTGSATSGYVRNYTYDTRLATQSPPGFLKPTVYRYAPVQVYELNPVWAWNAP